MHSVCDRVAIKLGREHALLAHKSITGNVTIDEGLCCGLARSHLYYYLAVCSWGKIGKRPGVEGAGVRRGIGNDNTVRGS
jgi:hypothetical protein